MKTRTALGLAALLALGHCDRGHDAPPARPPVTTPPRVVVLLVVDQLPSWSFDGQRSALRGGIARLLEHGSYWPRARYPYACTHTAPGHATIATGTTPSVHGIIANRWYDRALGRRVEVDEDPAAPVLDPRTGAAGTAGVSAQRLAVPGLADALHAAQPGAKAVTIGWKSRAALLVGGQHPDLALWFDTELGALTTSTAFGAAVPAWVAAFARAHPIQPLVDAAWTPSDPQRVARLAAHADDVAAEGDPYGLGRVFPHRAAASPSPNKALAFTPAANTLLVDAAIAAIDGAQLGADAVPDLLAVTFSPHDFAGHVWCQESWERVDHLLGIDRDLARLFDALDRRVGRGAWAAVLTSDHGTRPSPVQLRADGHEGPFFHIDTLAAVTDEAIDAVLGPGDWVLGATTHDVTLTTAFAARSPAERTRALDAAIAALRGIGLAWADRTDAMTAPCRGDDVAVAVCNSVFPGRSGELYVAAPRWGLVNDEHGECTAHGSPWDYDREVPLLVMGPGFGPQIRTEVPSMLQVAPTVAALLGVAPPAAAHAAALTGASGATP